MRALQPEVLHLHSSKAGFLGRGAQTLHRWPCRTLYSPHGLAFLDPERSARNALFRSLEWLAARSGAIPVGCGRGEADLLSSLSGREALLLEHPVDHFFCMKARSRRGALVVTLGRLSRQAPECAAVARVVRQRARRRASSGLATVTRRIGRAREAVAGHGVVQPSRSAHLARRVYLQSSRWGARSQSSGARHRVPVSSTTASATATR
jgi:hypothetical protein